MKLQPDDTTPEAEHALIEMLRRAPTWKRAEQLAGLIHSRNVLILTDLRRRYPEAGEVDDQAMRRALWAGRLEVSDLLEGLLGEAGLGRV